MGGGFLLKGAVGDNREGGPAEGMQRGTGAGVGPGSDRQATP
jgi:hypothetical protein